MTTSMASGDALTDLEDLITCNICMNQFDGRDPRSLTCLHVFCLECIKQFYQSMIEENLKHKNTLRCPICRVVTTLRTGSADELPQYFQANQVKDIINKYRNQNQPPDQGSAPSLYPDLQFPPKMVPTAPTEEMILLQMLQTSADLNPQPPTQVTPSTIPPTVTLQGIQPAAPPRPVQPISYTPAKSVQQVPQQAAPPRPVQQLPQTAPQPRPFQMTPQAAATPRPFQMTPQAAASPRPVQQVPQPAAPPRLVQPIPQAAATPRPVQPTLKAAAPTRPVQPIPQAAPTPRPVQPTLQSAAPYRPIQQVPQPAAPPRPVQQVPQTAAPPRPFQMTPQTAALPRLVQQVPPKAAPPRPVQATPQTAAPARPFQMTPQAAAQPATVTQGTQPAPQPITVQQGMLITAPPMPIPHVTQISAQPIPERIHYVNTGPNGQLLATLKNWQISVQNLVDVSSFQNGDVVVAARDTITIHNVFKAQPKHDELVMPAFHHPTACAMNWNHDKIAITDNCGEINLFKLRKGKVQSKGYDIGGGQLTSVAFTPSGNVVIGSQNENNLLKLSDTGLLVWKKKVPHEVKHLTVDNRSRIIIASENGMKVYNKHGWKVFSFPKSSSALNTLGSIQGLCTDSHCHIFIANQHSVLMFSSDGVFLTEILNFRGGPALPIRMSLGDDCHLAVGVSFPGLNRPCEVYLYQLNTQSLGS